MAKVALLVGVSEYQPGLNPLPGAAKDVEAVQRVLQHPEIGSFTEVKTLLNPDPLVMQEAIEHLFANRHKNDLVLLFFSGHGLKDEVGKLYFATRITRKNDKNQLIRSTAVPASFIHDIMSYSLSRRQIVILDCCFSGAFAEGLLAKDDGFVDIKNQLGGEGRAILTSSTATQYSFEDRGEALSVYSRYLVEGIETGAADLDKDGVISIEELHEYAKKKVQEATPAMKPEIYAVKEGYKIHLANAPIDDPKLKYRQEVEYWASRNQITSIGRVALDELRDSLGVSPEDAAAIEAEVLKPYRERQEKLQRYEQVLHKMIQREYPLSDKVRDDLKRLQQVLGLRNEDIAPIEARIAAQMRSLSSPILVQAASISQNRNVTATKSADENLAAPLVEILIPAKHLSTAVPVFTQNKLYIGLSVATILVAIAYFGMTSLPDRVSSPNSDRDDTALSTAQPSNVLIKRFNLFGYNYLWSEGKVNCISNSSCEYTKSKVSDLEVSGNNVTINYEYPGKNGVLQGVLKGVLKDYQLKGQWSQAKNSGDFEFIFTSDFSSAKGWWTYKGESIKRDASLR
jgi:hypothetical protein